MKVILHTDLSPEECIGRLRGKVDTRFFAWQDMIPFGFLFGRDIPRVRGWIKDFNFRLWRHKYYHNSSSPIFYGTLTPDGAGSRVNGKLTMHWYVKGFLYLWFGLWCLFALAGLSSGSREFLFTILGVGAFAVAMVVFCTWLARGEGKYLVSFLKETLDATTVGGSADS